MSRNESGTPDLEIDRKTGGRMTSTARLLLFTIQEKRYALNLQAVAEVMPSPVTFPVPWAPPYLKGVMNFHGSLVAVLDLPHFLGIGTMADSGNVLVLDRTIGNLALGVDRVDNIVPIDEILEEEQGSDPIVEKVLVVADGQVHQLAVNMVLERVIDAMQR